MFISQTPARVYFTDTGTNTYEWRWTEVGLYPAGGAENKFLAPARSLCACAGPHTYESSPSTVAGGRVCGRRRNIAGRRSTVSLRVRFLLFTHVLLFRLCYAIVVVCILCYVSCFMLYELCIMCCVLVVYWYMLSCICLFCLISACQAVSACTSTCAYRRSGHGGYI